MFGSGCWEGALSLERLIRERFCSCTHLPTIGRGTFGRESFLSQNGISHEGNPSSVCSVNKNYWRQKLQEKILRKFLILKKNMQKLKFYGKVVIKFSNCNEHFWQKNQHKISRSNGLLAVFCISFHFKINPITPNDNNNNPNITQPCLFVNEIRLPLDVGKARTKFQKKFTGEGSFPQFLSPILYGSHQPTPLFGSSTAS